MIAEPVPAVSVYLLCQYPKRPMSFAPHGWKTILPLRYLQVPHTLVYVTLYELRNELPKRFGKSKVTLPTMVIQHANKEAVIMDSFDIAIYLEKNFGTHERSLFNGDIGRQYARFMEQWVDRSLAAEIRPCVLHTSYDRFPEDGPLADGASRTAFLDKCGQTRMDELRALNADVEWTAKQYTAVRKELGTLEVVLRERTERGDPAKFLGGAKPCHADFCVFAFYAYSRTNKELVADTWHHDSVPSVKTWIEAFYAYGLVKEDELLPLLPL